MNWFEIKTHEERLFSLFPYKFKFNLKPASARFHLSTLFTAIKSRLPVNYFKGSLGRSSLQLPRQQQSSPFLPRTTQPPLLPHVVYRAHGMFSSLTTTLWVLLYKMKMKVGPCNIAWLFHSTSDEECELVVAPIN